jgi:hypothetical protein
MGFLGFYQCWVGMTKIVKIEKGFKSVLGLNRQGITLSDALSETQLQGFI